MNVYADSSRRFLLAPPSVTRYDRRKKHHRIPTNAPAVEGHNHEADGRLSVERAPPRDTRRPARGIVRHVSSTRQNQVHLKCHRPEHASSLANNATPHTTGVNV